MPYKDWTWPQWKWPKTWKWIWKCWNKSSEQQTNNWSWNFWRYCNSRKNMNRQGCTSRKNIIKNNSDE